MTILRSGGNFRFGYEKGVECKDESRTIQSMKAEADINTLVKRFGLLDQMPENVPVPHIDIAEVFDFQSAMNKVRQAQESFDRMPAPVRSRFNNDPIKFAEFCSDVDNLDEMRKMGLAVDKPKESSDVKPSGSAPESSGAAA